MDGHHRFWFFASVCLYTLIMQSINCDNILYGAEDVYEDSTILTAPCILKLSEKYFASKVKSQGSLVVVNLKPDASLFQRNILNALNENDKHDLAVMVKDARKDHWNASHVTEKARNYLMLLNDKSELTSTIKQCRDLPTWNPLAQFVIFFLRSMPPEELDNQTKAVITELFWNNVLNVNVMSQRINTNVVQSFTWFPYEGNQCATHFTELHLIDECECALVEDPEIKGIKQEFRIKNYKTKWLKIPDLFHDCPLRIGAVKWEPFIHYSPYSGFYKGIEYFMINTAAQQMDLRPDFTLITNKEWNYFGSTTNGTLFFDKVLTNQVEMMIGGLTENVVSRALLTPSIKYFQDDITLCTAKASLAPSWMNVFAIFNTTIWLLVLLFLLSSAYLLWRNSKSDKTSQGNISWGFLQALAMTLNTYATYVPRKLGVRLFYLCLAFYGIHFHTVYQSFLITVLTRPRFESQISTIDMAVQQGLHFKGSENTYNFFLSNVETSSAARYIVKNYEICTDIDKCLKEISKDQKLAVAVSREHSENSPLMRKKDMFCFSRSNNIYNYLVSILARRHHHLVKKINRNIRGITEAGLLNKWLLDSQRDSDVMNFNTNAEAESEQIVLKIQHVQGAFIVMFIGHLIASIVFLFEIVFYKLQRQGSWTALRRLENTLCYNTPNTSKHTQRMRIDNRCFYERTKRSQSIQSCQRLSTQFSEYRRYSQPNENYDAYLNCSTEYLK